MTTIVIPIDTVHNERTDPGDSDHWGDVESAILVEERFGDHCLTGLSDFSHVEVIFFFHQLAEREDNRRPSRPRGRADLPEVGVFCDRGPRRPNLIGCTICKVIGASGRELRVRGLDAVDGTPIIDIKPVMRQLIPERVHQPDWVDALMREYFTPAPDPGSAHHPRRRGRVRLS
jgi:tRNA (adenine37-N6)-methyltransferase